MALRIIGILFFVGAWLVYKSDKRTADTASDVSPNNPKQLFIRPLYRVLCIVGAVLTIIGVLTGW